MTIQLLQTHTSWDSGGAAPIRVTRLIGALITAYLGTQDDQTSVQVQMCIGTSQVLYIIQGAVKSYSWSWHLCLQDQEVEKQEHTHAMAPVHMQQAPKWIHTNTTYIG